MRTYVRPPQQFTLVSYRLEALYSVLGYQGGVFWSLGSLCSYHLHKHTIVCSCARAESAQLFFYCFSIGILVKHKRNSYFCTRTQWPSVCEITSLLPMPIYVPFYLCCYNLTTHSLLKRTNRSSSLVFIFIRTLLQKRRCDHTKHPFQNT